MAGKIHLLILMKRYFQGESKAELRAFLPVNIYSWGSREGLRINLTHALLGQTKNLSDNFTAHSNATASLRKFNVNFRILLSCRRRKDNNFALGFCSALWGAARPGMRKITKDIHVQSRVCRWLRYARAATRRFNNFYGSEG